MIEIDLDSPDAAALAVGRLDRGLSFFKPSLGLTVVDVADLEGPVVVAVDPNGPAAKAGVQPGDVVLRANSQPVPDAAALTTLLAGRKADEDMTLDMKDKAGAAKKADVKVFMTPAADRAQRSIADDQQDPRRPARPTASSRAIRSPIR